MVVDACPTTHDDKKLKLKLNPSETAETEYSVNTEILFIINGRHLRKTRLSDVADFMRLYAYFRCVGVNPRGEASSNVILSNDPDGFTIGVFDEMFLLSNGTWARAIGNDESAYSQLMDVLKSSPSSSMFAQSALVIPLYVCASSSPEKKKEDCQVIIADTLKDEKDLWNELFPQYQRTLLCDEQLNESYFPL